MNIYRTPFLLPLLYPGLVWRIPEQDKTIYLTFDDGPIPGPTEFVLDTLKGFNIKATFFCIGDNVRKNPEIFQRIISEGHRVANHTFNHLKGWTTSNELYTSNVELCQDEMAKYQWPLSTLFRPPYGRITRRQIKTLSDYKIIMWDVLTNDYNERIKPENCLAGSVRATRGGSIVVFHDSRKAERNMKFVLPRYISHFSKEGYTFGILPDH